MGGLAIGSVSHVFGLTCNVIILVTIISGEFQWGLGGGSSEFVDLFIDPTADFIL